MCRIPGFIQNGNFESKEFPENKIRDIIVALTILVISTWILAPEAVSSTIRAVEIYQLDGSISSNYTGQLWSVLPIFIMTFIGTVEVHERIHRRVGILLGYRPVLVRKRVYLADYVTFPGQYVRQGHNITNQLAPFFVISAFIGILGIADFHQFLNQIGLIAMIFNNSFAALDIFAATISIKYPANTYFRYSGDQSELYPDVLVPD